MTWASQCVGRTIIVFIYIKSCSCCFIMWFNNVARMVRNEKHATNVVLYVITKSPEFMGFPNIAKNWMVHFRKKNHFRLLVSQKKINHESQKKSRSLRWIALRALIESIIDYTDVFFPDSRCIRKTTGFVFVLQNEKNVSSKRYVGKFVILWLWFYPLIIMVLHRQKLWENLEIVNRS